MQLNKASGFTIVELLLTLGIAAIMVGFALPQFQVTLANYQIRGIAEEMLSGLNLARAEAIRLNSDVKFVKSGTASWQVSQTNPAKLIQEKLAPNLPGSISVISLNDQTATTYNSFGRISNYTTLNTLTRLQIKSSIQGTDQIQIDIFSGGSTRMCLLNSTTINDPKKC